MKYALSLFLLLAGTVPAAAAEIPVRDFLRPPTVKEVRLSRDGSKLLVASSDDVRGTLTVLEAATLKPLRSWRLEVDNFPHAPYWIDDEHFVFQTRYKLDFDWGETLLDSLYLLGVDSLEPRRFRLGVSERVFAIGAGERPRLLIEGSDNNRPALFDLDLESGDRDLIAAANATQGNFVVDREGEPRYFVGETYKRDRVIQQREGRGWKTIYSGPIDNASRLPERMGPDGRSVYFRSTTPEGRVGLEKFDPASAGFSWVSKNPRYDVEDVLVAADSHTVIAVAYEADRPTFHFVHAEHPEAGTYKQLMRAFPDHALDFIDVSGDGRWLLLRAYSDRDAGQLYLFDREKGQARFLMANREWLDPARMAEQRPVRFTARDGLEIEGYLWVPAGASGKRMPLVVRPHGGPHDVRDTWGFDPEAQLLASRGYAVLAVNYRGSGGYGPGFQQRGYRHWGTAMVDDVSDGARWAVEQGLADKDRLCIYGMSYGAFSALMGAAREPELYRCAVGLSGVYDIRSMYRADRQRSTWMGNYFEEIYPETPAERDAQSPATHAASIRAAVMLAHGEADAVTPLEQFRSMKRALAAAGNPVQVSLQKEKEGHGFSKLENRVEFYEALLAFLDRHIGESR